LDDLARMFNAHIRGWINYYGRFYPSALYRTWSVSPADSGHGGLMWTTLRRFGR
jgi:RNA-directed DNA polymerase